MNNLVNNNQTSAEIWRESEERFRAIINQATAGIAETDLTGKFLLVNDRYCEILGYPREELLEMRMQDITHEEDLPHNRELFGQMIERGESFVIERRYVRKDGSEVWVSNSVSVVRNAAGDPQNVLTVTIDISERRRAEENQKLMLEIGEKLRLAENTGDLLFDISKSVGEHLKVRRCLFNEIDLERDLETVHRDYCRQASSVAGVHRISDYSPVTTAEMQAGRTVVNRDSQTDPRTAAFYEQIYAPNDERAYIAVPLMRKGQWVASLWVSDDRPRNWSEQEIGLLEAVAERTWLTVEKLRNEVALRESEERFSKAFQTTPHLMSISTLEDGRYLSVNDSILRTTGYTREEMIGRSSSELNMFPEPEGRAKLLDAFRNGVVRDLEIKVRMKSGETRLLKLSADIITLRGEKCILTSSIDITDSKRAEEALRESEEKFRTLSEAAPALIWFDDAEGNCLYVNQQYLDFSGKTSEEIKGTGWHLVLHPEDAEGYISDFLEAQREQRAFHHRVRAQRHDGEWRWIESFAEPLFGADGAFLGHVGISPDITASVEAENVLRESEESYRILAETASDAIIRIDENSVIQFVNTAAERIFGYAAPEMVGQSLTMLMPEEMRERHRAGFRRYLQTGKRSLNWESIEVPARHKDGHYFPLEISFGEYHRGETRFFIGVARDITERRKAQELLRESEERFAKAFNSSPLVVTITSLKTGKLVEVNETFVNMTGYSREEAIGRTTAELGLWQKEDDRDAELELVQSRGQIRTREYRFRMRNGKEIVGLLSAELLEIGGELCSLTVIQDITERKLAEELISESEEKFRNLANSISQFAWMTDASGYIFWFNKRWFEYTGATLEEMQGWGWQKVHHPDEIERVTEKFKRHLVSGEIWEDTFPLRSKTGEYRWFLSRAVPIRDDNGQIVRWIGTNTDIEEVRRARLQAEQANRLKDEFLATVSHELRTPLNAILGWSNMLQSGRADDEMKDRAMEVIYRNAKSQAQLIEDLLDVSRIITGKMRIEPRPVGFAPVIQSAIDTIRPAADAKSIELETDIDCETCLVGADPQRLQQIVWNLLSNAVKFTPEGGKVEVLLENAGSHARLTVRDTGKGIEPEFIAFMFERFRQEDASSTRRHGGLGLGLAIVRHLVELHGGTIAATSAGENLGSTFTVELPLAFSDEKPGGEETKNLRETLSDGFGKYRTLKKLKGIRVLLVDDELDTLEMLDTALTDSGADVRVASSAPDAFEILHDWQPDVLVSDIAMPDEDGYSLIKKVRELSADGGGLIPAIAMTAYVRAEDKMRVLASGFQSYIPKPAEPTELIAAILDLTNLSSG